MLHYGFLPARNPHDSVALFTDIESGIEFWLEEYLPKVLQNEKGCLFLIDIPAPLPWEHVMATCGRPWHLCAHYPPSLPPTH